MNSKPILLPLPQDFSFGECLWMLDRGFDDCLHRIDGRRVIKAVNVNKALVLIGITEWAGGLRIDVLHGRTDNTSKAAVTAYVKDWLDTDRDIRPFYKMLGQHKTLAWMGSEFAGLRLIGIPDLFEAVCWAIIGQQINLTFAFRLKRRLVEKYGMQLEHGAELYHLFPQPETLAAATVADLRAMRFSTSKADYLIRTAQAFAAGAISKEQLQALPDVAARQQALIRLRGIGIWTANYAMMKSLREPGSIPYGDAGMDNALIRHGIMKDKTDLPAMQNLFAQFSGWESYLVAYLWRSLSEK